MTLRAGEWRARLLLALLSTGLTLGFAEGVARILLRPSPPGPVEGTPISELSQTLGWKTRPGGSQRVRREDFDVTISINSRGLRGPEIPYDAPPGVRRLAVMGDSFAHGYYAQEEETLRGRLATALGACRVEVLNAGSPGYSTDQEWLYYSEEIRKYHPTEVVLLFYYNDLVFNVLGMGTANRAKPLFIEKEGALTLIPPPPPPPPPPDVSEPERSPEPPAAARFHHSALWAFAAGRLQRSRPDWSRTLAGYGLAPDLSTDPPAEYLPFAPADASERTRVEAMWKRTAALLGGFRDDVRNGGAGFSLFYVPARFEVNDPAWDFVKRRYAAGRPWRRDAVRTRLAELAATLDIPLLDATEAFRTAETSKTPSYLAIDGHWNARGNEIAFESLFPSMRRAFSCAS